jgi:hypothetical protein
MKAFTPSSPSVGDRAGCLPFADQYENQGLSLIPSLPLARWPESNDRYSTGNRMFFHRAVSRPLRRRCSKPRLDMNTYSSVPNRASTIESSNESIRSPHRSHSVGTRWANPDLEDFEETGLHKSVDLAVVCSMRKHQFARASASGNSQRPGSHCRRARKLFPTPSLGYTTR